MISDTERPLSPGSFNEFCAESKLEGDEAIRGYSESLQKFREQLAQRAGVSLEDLHEMRRTREDETLEMNEGESMSELRTHLERIAAEIDMDSPEYTTALFDAIRAAITQAGYDIVEEDVNRPWGAFFRMDSEQAQKFMNEFFPGDVAEGEVSPKILAALMGQRLSLQRHDRRAEKWLFITGGSYVRGMNEDDLQEFEAKPGDVVQYEAGEIHRLCGSKTGVTLVAEQWQHTDPDNPSDEADIERLEDDYKR